VYIPVPEQIVLLLDLLQKQATLQTKGFVGAGAHNYPVHAD
jgi:hypothetical protein